MNKLGTLAIGLLFVGSAYADEVPADYEEEEMASEVIEEVADDAAAEETPPPEDTYSEPAPADDYAAAEEEAVEEDVVEEEESDPWELYVGGDYVWTNVSFSKDQYSADFGADELDSSMYRIRAGMRLFKKIGVEVQIGKGNDDSDSLEADEYSTEQFYGVYIVPTGVLLNLFEVAAPIGYASTKLERPGAAETLDGVSFGVNVEIPLYTSDSLELRVGGGGEMFRAQNSARIRGYHAGVRIDFRI